MSKYPESLDHMLAAWQELDAAKVRGHLEQALADDVHFVDPQNDVRGIDAFEAMVHEFRKRFPTAQLDRASAIDGHHGLYRYDWEIRVDGKLMMPGFDVSEVDKSGKVSRVLGFFGPLPGRES